MKIVIMEPLGISSDSFKTLSLLLRADGHQVIAYDERAKNDEELIERVKDADVLILANQPLHRNIIEACVNLKLVDVAFTGLDHVDLDACREREIMVCNAAGYSTNAVAELVFGLIIDLYRAISASDMQLREGEVSRRPGIELKGKTLGIIGTGAIGLRVAEIGKVFGCNLLAYSRSVKPEGEALGIHYESMEDVFKNSDIVSLHLPLTPQTARIIGAQQLGLMKPSAILINTARGGIIDNEALASALNEGRIAGAGIDVFDEEPPFSSFEPLLTAKNTVLTPHIAFSTRESLYQRAVIVFDNVRCWLEGNPQNVKF
jgi:phosphoglycerate dehydrogenase-like enzyme